MWCPRMSFINILLVNKLYFFSNDEDTRGEGFNLQVPQQPSRGVFKLRGEFFQPTTAVMKD